MKTLSVILLFLTVSASQAADENMQFMSIEDTNAVFSMADQTVEIDQLNFKGPFKWACYAENRYRERFRGVHSNRRTAEEIAVQECYRWSRRCYYAGCDRIIQIPF